MEEINNLIFKFHHRNYSKVYTRLQSNSFLLKNEVAAVLTLAVGVRAGDTEVRVLMCLALRFRVFSSNSYTF